MFMGYKPHVHGSRVSNVNTRVIIMFIHHIVSALSFACIGDVINKITFTLGVITSSSIKVVDYWL